ncbi:MAG: DUF2071 domain-containing protein [Planctomycetes bacterium]|nr:DUF2071 domain-containing protein [Planctomycetota bacterium]
MSFQPPPNVLSQAAHARLVETEGAPLLLANWSRTLMLHFEADADALQRAVPFELDRHHGVAYVSLVAFTQERLRPRRGGRFTEWLSRPVATHGFLNLRTYVKHGGERGIFFLGEWIPNRLAQWLGPRLFGLPYRLGSVAYRHAHESGTLAGEVRPADVPGGLRYAARIDPSWEFDPPPPGSRSHFLMERYSAFCARKSWRGRFRIWHKPWPQVHVAVKFDSLDLLQGLGAWARELRYAGANYSPGVQDVWIGRPARLEAPVPRAAPTAARPSTARLRPAVELPQSKPG